MSLLERTLSEIAKPNWEGAPGFGHAWDECVRTAQSLEAPREWREWACAMLPMLGGARVLIVDGEQARVLPVLEAKAPGEAADFRLLQSAMKQITLPWDLVYIEFAGGVLRDDYDPAKGGSVTGALIGRGLGIEKIVGSGVPADGLWVQTFIDAPRGFRSGSGAQAGMLCQAAGDGESPLVISPLFFLRETTIQRIMGSHVVRSEGIRSIDELKEEVCRVSYDSGERSLAVLQWLESVNVEIVDQQVSRQVRRAADRRGAQIAKVVRVKLPKTRRDGEARSFGHSVEFSHRFEVRGHYKFFPESTRLAQAAPEKLSWVPERDGYFRRLWCPPFVKGPVDKPMIPKSRLLIGS